MKLKLLGQADKTSTSRYLGLDRPSPGYIGQLEDTHAVNQTFYRYLYEADDFGFLQDLNFCEEMVKTYRSLKPPQRFDIVEVTTNNELPVANPAKFLGFDVACVYRISLLSWGLELDREPSSNIGSEDLICSLLPLFKLLRVHFQPQLNENGLFDDYEVAAFFLQTMMALQKARPNLWEGDDCHFEVLGLWQLA
jgi:hypothetical protein